MAASTPDYLSPFMKMHSDANTDKFGMIASTVFAILCGILGYSLWKSAPKKQKALDPENWISMPLRQIEEISHDVRRFRFFFPTPMHILGLPIGQHISFKFTDPEGKEVQRSYTPTTSDEESGYVDFMIKVYFKDTHPKFPDGGKMSQHLNNMKIGDTMLMKGPKGHLDYKGKGKFTILHKREVTQYKKKKLGMVAGGTGITPMLQVIRAIQRDPKDMTEVWLLFANQSQEDILLREELEQCVKNSNGRFHLWFTVDRAPEGWKYSTGFINKEMCAGHLPPPSADSMIFCCGPPPMIKFACEPAFKELGYEESQWFTF
jgi:cytochrome-b5 reductase